MLSFLKNIDEFEFILASQSPRRYELLKMIGLNFKVQPSHAEEIFRDGEKKMPFNCSNIAG
jgi:septum formation protein